MRRAGPVLILIIGVAAALISFFPNLRLPDPAAPDGAWRLIETKLGLDLEGGLRVEYRALPRDGQTPDADAMSVIKEIVENRVNTTGVSEPVVVVQGSDRVVIELPGATDVDAVRRLVGSTGKVDFVPLGTTPASQGQIIDLAVNKPLFGGDQVTSPGIGTDQNGRLAVNFSLRNDPPVNASQVFSDFTAEHRGEYFAITLDATVISAPVINEPIPANGTIQIAGGSTGFLPAEANELVTVLKFGSLPFPIEEVSSEQISATLGEQFLAQSLFAGAIGVSLVIVFMLLFYRLPGAVATFALIYYGIVVYAIFRFVPVTLTLAGIAGFVLSVGMAVDANILIFERMKEELRLGKSLPAAVEAGFNRAWNSILDSNVSSLITATILYAIGSSTIRGFALVLIIGVLVSMFSAIVVTRSILRVIVRQDFARKASLYGLRDDEFIAHGAGRPSRRPVRADV
ncbi:MAG: protein translocase subunit SecD [Candidatus Limnocylindria bacterium]